MAAQSVAPIPARRDYKPEVKPVPLSALPFVCQPRRGFKNASNWRVPPTDDYGLACKMGAEYAAHYVQYLKNNSWVSSNLLGNIAKDIDFQDISDAMGYWVGFFSYLERLILAQAQRMDVFEDVDRVNAYYAEIEAKRALRAETGEG